MTDAPRTEAALDDLLSQPDEATIDALARLDGDLIVLGAGGKMGPTLARMARRALDEAALQRRKVIAVSRFSDGAVADLLRKSGVVVHHADLANPADVRALPYAENMIWMAGHKFGSSADPVLTWTHNVVASCMAAEQYAGARIVCFSSGNVYGRTAVERGGSRENDALIPDGEYAASVIGRERVFESIARRTQSPSVLFRLFYACDLRYGVVTDLALRIRNGQPVSLSTGWANVIWQGDANRLALRSLALSTTSPGAMNATGPMVSIQEMCVALGNRLGRAPAFVDKPEQTALVANIDRLQQLLPGNLMPLETLVDWTATWITSGGRILGKPTKYEVRDGRF